MKKNGFLVLALLLGFAIAFVFARQGDAGALNVNEVGSDPTAFKGTITVTGIMDGVSPQEPTIFGIMDKKELQCKSANCNKLLLAVKFQGALPVRGDEVKVTGSFVNDGNGFLFAADKVEVVRNHRIGG